jgi:hypothetical protein
MEHFTMKPNRHVFLLSILLLIAGCLIPLLVSSANAALINGSFESPDVPSHTAFNSGTPTGWATSPGTVIYTQDSSGGGLSGLPSAQNGDQYVGMTANTGWSLFQNFTIPAGDYTISWYDNSSPGHV